MKLLALLLSLSVLFGGVAQAATLHEGWQEVDGLHLFYREAGNPADPTVVFLHGNPLSSIMYVKLMENLAARGKLHVIALDYPSFGYSDAPDHLAYRYTFDHLAQTVADFLQVRGITRYSLYMQDYGVPVGFRLISAHPEAIASIMVQNGVIHLDGFPKAQDPNGELRRHWMQRNPEVDRRRAGYIAGLAYPQAAGWEDEDHAGPDATAQMVAAVQRPGVVEARNDLWFDYGSNVARYPAWQAALRRLKVPVLVLWGQRDQFFTTPGAYAYRRDAPQAEVHVLDSTHFATLDQPETVAALVGAFLEQHRAALLPVDRR
jgi:pimeloyl-ACP methyl ester carboxylesterase